MDPRTAPPLLIILPSDDQPFTELVRVRAAELHARNALTPRALTAALRSWYPKTAARPREALASLVPDPCWYVYRDGGARKGSGTWWERDGVARVEFDHEARFVAANQAAAAIAGRSVTELVGTSYADIIAVPDDGAAEIVWRALLRDGRVQSTAVLQLLDGTRRTIEYISLVIADGRYESRWRDVARVVLDG